MAFVRVNGVLLHYRLRGPEGAPVVALANSLGTDLRIWDAVGDILADGRKTLTYDKRGHGLSDAPPGDYSLDDHVGDLAGLVDHLGIDRLALAGVSIGGLIAQGFALRYPSRLASLVLCDTAPILGDAQSWTARIDAIKAGGLASIADSIMERWFSEPYRREQPEALAGWRNLFLRTPADGYCSTCATLRDTDLSGAICAISVPTLVVVGDHDASTPVAMVRSAAEAIAGARFEIIAGAGHLPCIEQPEALAALMQQTFKDAGHG